MSALTETGHKVKGLEVGAVDYITKPFQRDELLARIAVHLKIRELNCRLQESNELLELRVMERTADLARANSELQAEIVVRKSAEENELKLERQLRQSRKMEAIGTLAAGIAHDFNNILTAIVGFTELSLTRLPSADPVRGDLEVVLESGLRATDLVRQILTFSRQTELERKPVRLDSIIKEVLKLLRSSLPSSIEIRTEYDINPAECVVDADLTQVHQVLMNLCTNASHAMRRQGGVLSVTLERVMVEAALVSQHPSLKPGPHVGLTVRDTGHGMDAALMERIFDPYFTTKKTGEGTGMGLAVTMGIVKNHGGAIAVSSQPGQGTSFQVLLPRAIPDDRQAVETREALHTGNEHILFIDDEKALAVLGQKMLEALGYRVTAGTNSLEALELFRSQPDAFDLVITDMTMPGLTGRELTRELLSIRPDIPVLMCSGFAEFVNPNEAREAGIREFLMKPYVIGTLAKTIRKVL
jgi:signal transduction histidine kinase